MSEGLAGTPKTKKKQIVLQIRLYSQTLLTSASPIWKKRPSTEAPSSKKTKHRTSIF